MKNSLFLLCFFITTSLHAQTINIKKIASDLETPWGITFINDQTLFITEKSGSAHLININTNKLTSVSGLPTVDTSGQGGLLDVALLPKHFNTQSLPILYFTYSKSLIDGTVTTLAKAELKGSQLIHWQDLLVSESFSSTTRHFGSRIAFDQNGHVFFSIGDRGHRPNGQDLNTHAGSILRLNLDGSVPKDNPFVKNKNALPEIWSYGHRNPQGLTFDQHNNLWSIEHGPRGGDEINLIKKGANYGWPIISYGKEYWGPISVGEGTHKPGMEQPVKYYVPSIAPGSLVSYKGHAFKQWNNTLLSGALKLRHLNVIHIDENNRAIKEERELSHLNQRIRAIAESSDGLLFISTDRGNLYRLSP